MTKPKTVQNKLGACCDHGSLARSCEICQRDREIEELRHELETWTKLAQGRYSPEHADLVIAFELVTKRADNAEKSLAASHAEAHRMAGYVVTLEGAVDLESSTRTKPEFLSRLARTILAREAPQTECGRGEAIGQEFRATTTRPVPFSGPCKSIWAPENQCEHKHPIGFCPSCDKENTRDSVLEEAARICENLGRQGPWSGLNYAAAIRAAKTGGGK
jgi:hypothetical protein